jgi:hypothetical protein
MTQWRRQSSLTDITPLPPKCQPSTLVKRSQHKQRRRFTAESGQIVSPDPFKSHRATTQAYDSIVAAASAAAVASLAGKQ